MQTSHGTEAWIMPLTLFFTAYVLNYSGTYVATWRFYSLYFIKHKNLSPSMNYELEGTDLGVDLAATMSFLLLISQF